MAADVANRVTLAEPPRELERIPLVANNRSIGWISDAISRCTVGNKKRRRSEAASSWAPALSRSRSVAITQLLSARFRE